MIAKYIEQILHEVSFILCTISEKEINNFVSNIIHSKKIIVYGAGRVGMAARGFAMRLGHLGFNAYTVGDSTVPNIGENDLLIIASGSGETQTVFDIAAIGKKNGAKLALITGRPESRIGNIADIIVVMKTPSKVSNFEGFKSIQPMTTLNEQCLQLLFDAIVLVLMDETKQTHKEMWERHSNLE